MKFNKLPNGALQIQSELEDLEALAAIKDRCGGDDVMFLAELLEYTGWQGNGRLFQVKPEDVGALTDAPLMTDDCRIEDDGTVQVFGSVWWFPNYMVTNFAEKLIEAGKVVFALGSPALSPA